MAIFGWIVCVVIMVMVSFIAVAMLLNCTGTFNIGGAANSFFTKFKAWLFAFVVGYGWYLIAMTFPFIVSIK